MPSQDTIDVADKPGKPLTIAEAYDPVNTTQIKLEDLVRLNSQISMDLHAARLELREVLREKAGAPWE